MLFRDVISLISISESPTPTINDFGDAIMTETIKVVPANEKSVKQTEFYQAKATGLKPEKVFEIRSIEYNNQEKLIHNSKRYSIIRTYGANGEFIELVCEGIVGTERGGK